MGCKQVRFKATYDHWISEREGDSGITESLNSPAPSFPNSQLIWTHRVLIVQKIKIMAHKTRKTKYLRSIV